MKKNNAWNIRCLVNESFIQTNQRTSELYSRLSDFMPFLIQNCVLIINWLVNAIFPFTLIWGNKCEINKNISLISDNSELESVWLSLICWPFRTSSKQYTHVAINICRPRIHAGGVNKWIYDSEKEKMQYSWEFFRNFCTNEGTDDLLFFLYIHIRKSI